MKTSFYKLNLLGNTSFCKFNRVVGISFYELNRFIGDIHVQVLNWLVKWLIVTNGNVHIRQLTFTTLPTYTVPRRWLFQFMFLVLSLPVFIKTLSLDNNNIFHLSFQVVILFYLFVLVYFCADKMRLYERSVDLIYTN